MAGQKYPSSVDLIITFLNNVRRYSINRISGMNPTLLNVRGEQIYIYIKNLSPAQLSNNNPDVWRIQLPKKPEFEDIKRSEKLFVLFGYDHNHKVYTTWNPYWCKQRLNVAESCSMYSRYLLQKRVSSTQKIERMQLQNEGDVICIPSSLLANYLMHIREYYPEESTYTPIGSSIQKRIIENSTNSNKSEAELLFEKFENCYDVEKFRLYLINKGYQKNTVSNYINRLIFVFENGFIKKHENIFLDYTRLNEYKHAVNRFCYQSDIRYYEELWHKAIMASLKQYLLFVEEQLYGTQTIRLKIDDIHHIDDNKEQKGRIISKPNKSKSRPVYTLDQFGKLIALDSIIIEQLLPLVRGVDYPDHSLMIEKVKMYYPQEVTQKMTPSDWMNLFDSTKWQKKRGRKSPMTDNNIDYSKAENEKIITEIETYSNSNNIEESVSLIDIDTSSSSKPLINFGDETLVDETEISTSIDNNASTNIPISKRTINTTDLNFVFEKKASSYKFFWFMAIITLAKDSGQLNLLYKDILIRMASLAWPIVITDKIKLGGNDLLEKYLNIILKNSILIRAASGKVVESYLKDYYYIKDVDKILSPLLKNVPYRFLSTWIKYTTDEEVTIKSNEPSFIGLYAIKDDGIVLNEDWWQHINSHFLEICDFALRSFIAYCRQYNSQFDLLNLMRTGWGMIKR